MTNSTESAAIVKLTPTDVVLRSHPLNGRGDHSEVDAQKADVPATDPLNGGVGHSSADTHSHRADTATLNADGGHIFVDAHKVDAPTSTPSEFNGHRSIATHHLNACELDPICDQLRELHRYRQDYHNEEKGTTNRIKAICRRLCNGDKPDSKLLYKAILGKGEHALVEPAYIACHTMLETRAMNRAVRKQYEKFMIAAAKKLPVSAWVESVRGFGLLGLAMIIGEAGNLFNYEGSAQLRQRMGIGGLPNGEIQRRRRGAAGIEHGYCPRRRSVLWVIGESLLKGQSERIDKKTGEVLRKAGPYRLIYDTRKAIELPRCEAMADAMKAKSSTGKYSYKRHAHNRAKRIMEKELIKDLWRAWRDHHTADSQRQIISSLPQPKKEAA